MFAAVPGVEGQRSFTTVPERSLRSIVMDTRAGECSGFGVRTVVGVFVYAGSGRSGTASGLPKRSRDVTWRSERAIACLRNGAARVLASG